MATKKNNKQKSRRNQSHRNMPGAAGENRSTIRNFHEYSSFNRYIRSIQQLNILTLEQEQELARKKNRSERAFKELVEGNLRLVIKIAKEYTQDETKLMDLINEGNIGLIKGIKKYTLKKGTKVSTYVSWWIHQSIRRYLGNHDRTIRIPIHAMAKRRKIDAVKQKISQELGREATDEEVRQDPNLQHINEQQMRKLNRMSTTTVPLDHSPNAEAEPLHNLIADPEAKQADDVVRREEAHQRLQQAINLLDSRNRFIIKKRFGLITGQEATLKEIGDYMGLTRERIRQLTLAAVERLRKKMELLEAGRPVRKDPEPKKMEFPEWIKFST